MWRQVRIALLLAVLLGVAVQAWIDRSTTRDWDATLWVGVYPLAADRSDATREYLAQLAREDFAPIEAFFVEQGAVYGVAAQPPVRVELYAPLSEPPPALPPDAGWLGTAWWSLQMRWYASRVPTAGGAAPPNIKLFVLFHDPGTLEALPHSVGLSKGLMGVVHAFASRTQRGGNHIVIAHEFLHTVGASDKYDPATLQPVFPIGFAEPEREPLLPQRYAELMAGRRALSPTEVEMPDSLRDVIIGPATALEIGWVAP
jgi:hypothetical protein